MKPKADSLPRRFAHIDFMRAVAVCLVVFQHSGLEQGLLGSAGVTMFFVISGFVITNRALEELASTGRFAVGGFYLRRALKLLPPLIALILIPSLVLGVVTNWRWLNPTSVASQALFFYNSVRINGQQGVLPGSDVLWSLSVEEQFYICFALLWLLCIRLPRPRVALTWLAATGFTFATVLRVILAGSGHQELAQQIYFSTPTRIDAISLGVLVALFLASARGQELLTRLSPLVWEGLLFLSVSVLFCALLLSGYMANYSWMISLHALCTSGILIAGFTPGRGILVSGLQRLSRGRVFQEIGIASYSVYLFHHTISLALSPATLGLPLLISILLKSVAGLSCGLAIWWILERPVENFKNRRLHSEWRLPATVG